MRVAYIWATAFWQISVLGGGSALTYLSGNGGWLAGGLFLMLSAGESLRRRLDKWSEENAQ